MKTFLGTNSPKKRYEVTKLIWKYITANSLQDPVNRSIVICDKKLASLTKMVKYKGFVVNKYIKHHFLDVAN